MKQVILIVLLVLGVSGLKAQNIGFSSMEKIDDSEFLVVFDKKNFQDGNRLAVLTVSEENGYSIKELKVKDWKHKEGRANDLEAVSAIPGTKNEYLLVEAGYWEGEFGRIFHVELNKEKIKIKKVYKIPSISPGGKSNPEGDNFEGVACIKHDGDLYVILGERGGTTRFPNGLLRIGILKEGAKQIDWETFAEDTFEVKLPKAVKTTKMMRTVTDLYLDKGGKLFASAAVDDSDIGPFKSVVYEVGTLEFKKGKLNIAKARKGKQVYTVDGFKIEAIAASPKFMKSSKLCFGTEDETYPGQWRPIYAGN